MQGEAMSVRIDAGSHTFRDAFVRHYIAPHGYQVTQIAENGCPRKAMALSAKATSTSAEAMA